MRPIGKNVSDSPGPYNPQNGIFRELSALKLCLIASYVDTFYVGIPRTRPGKAGPVSQICVKST